MFLLQYLKHVLSRAYFIFERFALLFCIGIVWAFAAILTVAGAYNNVENQTKESCRIDQASLISHASWYGINAGLTESCSALRLLPLLLINIYLVLFLVQD